jgi:periplasmic divalent cation tolerance protein
MGAEVGMADAAVWLVMITCADRAEAVAIGRALVEARLVACTHIRPHTAIYRWDGVVEEAEEAGLLVKTVAGNYAAIEAAVKARHRYALPAILAVPVVAGLAPFLDWVAAESGGVGQGDGLV